MTTTQGQVQSLANAWFGNPGAFPTFGLVWFNDGDNPDSNHAPFPLTGLIQYTDFDGRREGFQVLGGGSLPYEMRASYAGVASGDHTAIWRLLRNADTVAIDTEFSTGGLRFVSNDKTLSGTVAVSDGDIIHGQFSNPEGSGGAPTFPAGVAATHITLGPGDLTGTCVAEFSATPLFGPAPLEVVFTDESTGDIDSWLWDFGDGETSTEQNPTHVYASGGAYTVTLTVSGECDDTVEIKVSYVTVLGDCIDRQMIFDVYDIGTSDAPALTYLESLCSAFSQEFLYEADGVGAGKFSINRHTNPELTDPNPEATVAMLGDGIDVVRLIAVRLTAVSLTVPVFSFFLKTGDFKLLNPDEKGGEVLTFGGPGHLSYLGEAIMDGHSYLTSPFIGEDPIDGRWNLHLAGTGSEPGAILWRVLRETQEAARPAHPLPLLDMSSWDFNLDSTGDPWDTTAATDEFIENVGQNVLSVVGRLIGTGVLGLKMAWNLILDAFNRSNFGTDRTGGAFGAGVVRFQRGTNVIETSRAIQAGLRATHVTVKGDGDVYGYAAAPDAGTRPHKEVFVSAKGTDVPMLEAVGVAELEQRAIHSESVTVPVAVGDDPDNGFYLPCRDYFPGDRVTLHTGTGEHDFNEQGFDIAAITVREGNVSLSPTDLRVWLELGSIVKPPTASSEGNSGGAYNGGGSYGGGDIIESPGGGGGSDVGSHSHPEYQARSEEGDPDGYASLDSDGLVPSSQLGTGGTGGGTRFLTDNQTFIPLSAVGASFVPTYVPPATTFIIPDNSQALFALPIVLDVGAGISIGVNSALVEVD